MMDNKLYFVTFTTHETGGKVTVGCDLISAANEEEAKKRMAEVNAGKRLDSCDFRVYPIEEMLAKYGYVMTKKEIDTKEAVFVPKVPEKKTTADALDDFDKESE